MRREWVSGIINAELRFAPFLCTTVYGNKTTWDIVQLRDNLSPTVAAVGKRYGMQELRNTLAPMLTALGDGDGHWETLPVVAYYGVERAVDESALQVIRPQPDPLRLQALDGALDARSRFRAAFDWFWMLEDRERRQREERSEPAYHFPELQVVRNLLRRALPRCQNPRIALQPERLLVDMEAEDGTRETLDLGQLSDGYRTHLALVLDLARRMLQANPPPPDDSPEFQWGIDAPAIVLIDEVDLHLHPEWQQRVVPDLLAAFPQTQFILTTHSDQVLSSIPLDCQVWAVVRAGNGFRIEEPELQFHGARSEQILEDGMGVAARADTDYARQLSKYLELVNRGEGETSIARSLRQELDTIQADDPDLVRADARIRRLKLTA